MKTRFLILPIALLAPASILSGQTVSFNNSNGDWALSANWSTGALPAAPANAIVNGGRTANVTSVIAEAPTFIRIGNNSAGGTLNVSGGSLSGTHLQVATANPSTGSVNLSGGTLTVGAFSAASTTAGAATATVALSGGTLNWGSDFNIGTQGTATVTISGSAGTSYSGANLTVGSGNLVFLFDGGGINSLAATSSLSIDPSSTLAVDGSSYTGPGGTFTLITFGSSGRSGDFDGRTTITGFGDGNASLLYNNTSNSIDLVVIPEPMSAAAMGLAVLGAALFLRRRRTGR
jgi:MYXO-CTERM domain-containing protein